MSYPSFFRHTIYTQPSVGQLTVEPIPVSVLFFINMVTTKPKRKIEEVTPSSPSSTNKRKRKSSILDTPSSSFSSRNNSKTTKKVNNKSTKKSTIRKHILRKKSIHDEKKDKVDVDESWKWLSDNIEVGDIGFTFEKEFKGYGTFRGTVVQLRLGAANGKDRRCVYSDGDDEDLSLDEIHELVRLAKERRGKDIYAATEGDASECQMSDGARPNSTAALSMATFPIPPTPKVAPPTQQTLPPPTQVTQAETESSTEVNEPAIENTKEVSPTEVEKPQCKINQHEAEHSSTQAETTKVVKPATKNIKEASTTEMEKLRSKIIQLEAVHSKLQTEKNDDAKKYVEQVEKMKQNHESDREIIQNQKSSMKDKDNLISQQKEYLDKLKVKGEELFQELKTVKLSERQQKEQSAAHLEARHQENTKTTEEITRLKSHVQRLLEDNEVKTNYANSAKETLQKMGEKVASHVEIEKENEELKKMAESSTQELRTAKIDCEKLNMEHQKTARQIIRVKEAEKYALSKYDQMKEQLSTLQAEHKKVVERDERNSRFVSSIKETHANTEKTMAELQKVNGLLQEEIRKMSDKKDTFTASLDEERRKNAALETDNEKMQVEIQRLRIEERILHDAVLKSTLERVRAHHELRYGTS